MAGKSGLLERTRKDGESLSARIDDISAAWSEMQTPPQSYSSWPVEVYDDAVIVRQGEDYMKVPYTISTDGDPVFDVSAAVEVERTWVETPMEVAKVEIRKSDDERQIVFGWANVAAKADGSVVVDSEEDWIDVGDLEDAAYVFNLRFRSMDVEHDEETQGVLVESFVSTPDKLEKMGLEPDALPLGWWVGFYVPDQELYAKCGPGKEFEDFSIGGVGLKRDEAPPGGES